MRKPAKLPKSKDKGEAATPPPEVVDPVERERVEFVIECWARGYRNRQISRLFQAKYDMHEATAYRYMEKARAEIAEVTADSRENLIALSANRMDTVIRKCMARKDFQSVIRASQHRDNVLGLTNHELRVKNEGIVRHQHNVQLDPKIEKGLKDWARSFTRRAVNRGKS